MNTSVPSSQTGVGALDGWGGGWSSGRKLIIWQDLYRKLHENERNWTKNGAWVTKRHGMENKRMENKRTLELLKHTVFHYEHFDVSGAQ